MNSFEQPLELLKKKIGENIYIRLRNQTEIKGKLVAYDQHLNMMIQDLQMTVQQKTIEKTLMYLRGDSVQLVGKI